MQIPGTLASAAFALVVMAAAAARAGEADVVAVEATQGAGDLWTFHVTVRHADAGWDHYADRWEVVGSEGTVLATRVLLHPHVNEQPFTRSKSGISIPAGVSAVTVRAHDSLHGYGGLERKVSLVP